MSNTQQQLPPDPEGYNLSRAVRAGEAIDAYIAATGTAAEDALSDLLADLLHWADRHDDGFDEALDQARIHYAAETTPDRKEPTV